ncbi:MAG: hypothetical protein IPM91_03010 [Bacteroidetes bacterium]|nr:hypothetical protein [Bacteroidota bacterium]
MVQAAPLNIPAFENRICTQLYITNNLVLEDGIYSTQAAHVFIAVPDTLALPYLNNWVFCGQDTIYPVGGIIPIDTVFAVDRIVTGLLCASFVNCELENTPFTIYTGWNCASYPDTPFVPDPSLCHVDSFGFDISPQDVNLGNFGKAP